MPIDDGTIAAFDAPSGEKLWQTRVGPKGVISGLLLEPDRILGSAHGAPFALKLASGEFIFGSENTFDFGTTRLGPASTDGIAAFVTSEGLVEAVDIASGRRRWIIELPAEPSSGLVSEGGTFLIATQGRRIHRLSAETGEIVESHEVPAVLVDGPAVAPGYLIALTDERALVGILLATGKTSWIRNDYRFAPPRILVSEGEVVVGGSDGVLVGLAPATGETNWQRHLSGVVRGIARSGADVFAGNQDGQLFAVRVPFEP